MKIGIILCFLYFLLACIFVPLRAQTSSIDQKRIQLESQNTNSQYQLELLHQLSEELKAYSADSVLKYALLFQQKAGEQQDTLALSISHRLLAWSRGLMQQNIAQLIKDGQQALLFAEKTGDSTAVVEAKLTLTTGYVAMNQAAVAKASVDQALDYGQQHNSEEILYQAYNNAAYLALLTDLPKSDSLRRLSLQMAERLGDSVKIGIALNQLSSLLKLQKSEEAPAYFQRTKRLYSASPAPLYQSMFLFNMAEYYGDLGYSDSLLFYALEANQLADQTQNIQVQRVVKALIFAHYFNRQSYEEAEPFAKQALAIERTRPSLNYVSAFVDVARVEAALGRKDSARIYFNQSLAATKILNYPRAEVLARVYFGEFLKNEKKYDDALVQLRKAKALGDEKNEAAIRDFVLLQLAQVEFYKKNFLAARKLYQEAIELGNSANEADLLAQGYQALAQCDSALGRWEDAYKNQNRYLVWNDSLLRRTYNQKTAELEVRFETAQREAQIIQLEQERRIQSLELKQSQSRGNFLLGIAIILALAGGVVGLLLVRLQGQNREIQSQRSKLEGLNKTKDQLFAMISHDLRGPITGFQSAGKIFDHYLEKEDYQKLGSISQRLNSQATQLRQLLDNLLNWSLQQLGRYKAQIEPQSIHALGKEIVQRYASHAEAKNNEISVNIPEDLRWKVDKNGLSVVLNNLVGNAMKFTENGKIVLEAMEQKKDQELWIEVIDTGRGMTNEQASRLFSSEQQESQPGTSGEKGTGLGSQIVKQLMDIWGGKIEVESQLGNGSLIRLKLPSTSANLSYQ